MKLIPRINIFFFRLFYSYPFHILPLSLEPNEIIMQPFYVTGAKDNQFVTGWSNNCQDMHREEVPCIILCTNSYPA
jgi:hypothetical protein